MRKEIIIGLTASAVFISALKLESIYYQNQIEALKTAMNYQLQITKLETEKKCLEDELKSKPKEAKIILPPLPPTPPTPPTPPLPTRR
jgi:peptidoglycan hydrolase CwlO-like protein